MNMKMKSLVIAAGILAFAPPTFLSAATQSSPESSFLNKAAQGQQAEIALGQLAVRKASAPEVKQFGEKMLQDHQKANQEVTELASKEGVQLSMQMSDKHKNAQQELTQLSGKEFDRAYIRYMLKDHKEDVSDFEQKTQQLQDPDVKQWASSTLPLLKQHLKQAQMIASGLGLESQSQ